MDKRSPCWGKSPPSFFSVRARNGPGIDPTCVALKYPCQKGISTAAVKAITCPGWHKRLAPCVPLATGNHCLDTPAPDYFTPYFAIGERHLRNRNHCRRSALRCHCSCPEITHRSAKATRQNHWQQMPCSGIAAESGRAAELTKQREAAVIMPPPPRKAAPARAGFAHRSAKART
jgi:hypothetical protein